MLGTEGPTHSGWLGVVMATGCTVLVIREANERKVCIPYILRGLKTIVAITEHELALNRSVARIILRGVGRKYRIYSFFIHHSGRKTTKRNTLKGKQLNLTKYKIL